MNTITLNDGHRIPAIGFGTYEAKDQEVYEAVREALRAGYRHIDTAALYQNEEAVGKAIKDSGIPREEIFVTTKLWNDAHDYGKAKVAFQESLDRLGLDYIDLYLIHWPNPLALRDQWQSANRETWRALEELVETGKVRSIGVSNFMVHHLEALLESARIVPAVNQIRLAPGVYQKEVVDFCRDKNILLTAWAPLGRGELFQHPVMLELSQKYGVTVAQLSLAWSIQEGFVPLPKSVTFSRIRENIDLPDILLSEEDKLKLREITVENRALDPDTVTF
ncbi:aldo/keto reductase [Streptococcus sp. DD13]|uniref:aldo/keto reductase n=1 Tax=Streptococcus sp. DD13 TaxID=1777881 RepID=UPI00079C9ED6|nr:aldo/keto reductase [Streptococcus sp. DD13]KXT78130.1 oxidoreductase of aldo/keto reductase family, subgroup 1 [Streptococcus sp. DD13]